MGSARTRCPVSAKIAFASAGATGGTPGSPMPPGACSLGMTSVWIARGASGMRMSRKSRKFVCSVAPFLIVIAP